MAKIILPKFSKVTFIISGILFCIYLLIRILIKFNIYIYLFKIGVEVIIPIIIILVVALLIGAIAVLFYKNTKLKTLVVLTTTIFSFLILSYLSIFFLLTMYATYFEYTSDDKKHNIVVNEGSFLLSGYGDIYEKTSFCTMQKVGGYTTDDGFRPFSNDAFYFVWNENDFELYHSFFGSKSEEYRVVKMEYVK